MVLVPTHNLGIGKSATKCSYLRKSSLISLQYAVWIISLEANYEALERLGQGRQLGT